MKNTFNTGKYVLTLFLIISLGFNIFSYTKTKYNKQYMNVMYSRSQSMSLDSIRDAKALIDETINLKFTGYSRATNFLECSYKLSEASKLIKLHPIYFDYKEKGAPYSGEGAIRVDKFFYGYSNTLEIWAKSIYKNEELQPSNQDIEYLRDDLQNIINKFESISDEDTLNEFNSVIQELVEETKTKDIKARFNNN